MLINHQDIPLGFVLGLSGGERRDDEDAMISTFVAQLDYVRKMS